MRSRQTGQSQDVAAAKSGVSVRSGRRIERGERLHVPRTWRTREDPLGEVWETHLAPLLARAPDLTGLTLLEYLEDTFPGEYDGRILRLNFDAGAANFLRPSVYTDSHLSPLLM